MLDPLGGKQQSSPWFDNLSTSSTAMNSNSSGSSGSPLSLSSHLRDSLDALSRPTWLFNSQGRPARLFVQAGKERTRSPVEKTHLYSCSGHRSGPGQG
ncbi:unnamed protein product [Cylicocyclus nassatus]|uniref:Uncharacterized protein n=1 Tax=Cylicocyclus nassatus TaxID=53992 RepID=A0AA36MHH0_CYLNA|nr:unnamed protein product [Cylicocyclus nassatus]